MRSSLPTIALELGADERTLRRAAGRGAVRCSRATPRQLELAPGELDYLRSHWELLRSLSARCARSPTWALPCCTARLRAAMTVRIPMSTCLSGFATAPPAPPQLWRCVSEHALGRDVDVARLDRVRTQAPFLLVQALDEGRVLVDPGGRGPKLQQRRDRFVRAARKAIERDRREAAASLDMLLADG